MITQEMNQSLSKKHKDLDIVVEYVNRLHEEGEKFIHGKMLVSEAYNNQHLKNCGIGVQRRVSSLLKSELKLKIHKPQYSTQHSQRGQTIFQIPKNGITMERLKELGFKP